MKLKIILSIGILALAGCDSQPEADPTLNGRWTGGIAGDDIHVLFHGGDTPTGEFIFPSSSRTISAPIYVRDGMMRSNIEVAGIGAIAFSGVIQDSIIRGSVQLQSQELPFYFRRIHQLSDAAREALVGWYVDDQDDSLLFTYGPYGDIYFFDFDAISAGARYPIDDSTLARFDDTGSVDVRLRIRQDDGQTVLHLTDEGTQWTRLESQPYLQQEVAFNSDGLPLAGVLYCPTGGQLRPGLVYIHGSGGGNTRVDFHDMYMLNYLAMRGVAILIPDKRGCGKSGGNWRNASFEELARDALAATGPLLDCASVDPNRVGLFGFSQGGWIAPLAATMSNDIAFIVNASGAAVDLTDQVAHEMHNTFVAAGLTGEQLAQFDSLQMLAERYVADTSRWAEYAAMRERLMQTEAGSMASGFPGTPDNWRWQWAFSVGDFDPMPFYRQLDIPILVLYGKEDEQDNVPVAASVDRLMTLGDKVTVRVYEGSGHLLGVPSGDGYVRTDALDEILGFITP